MANKFNREGYYSPTEHEALKRIEREEQKTKYRPLVYICSPFSHGDVKENVRNARHYCRYAVEHHAIPFAPHLLFPQFMNDSEPAERSLAMLMNRIMLGKCDELWIFGSLISKGMKREIKWAKRKKINIRYISVKKG